MKYNEYKTVEIYPEKARFISAKFLHTVRISRELSLKVDSFSLIFLRILGKFFKKILKYAEMLIYMHVTYIVNYIHFTSIHCIIKKLAG